jgi:transmembrane sensor
MLRLRDDSLSNEELAAWSAWYEADERNKETFDEVRFFWQQSLRLVDDSSLQEGVALKRSRHRRTVWLAAAASIAAIAVSIALLLAPRNDHRVQPAAELVHQTVLPDGSRVDLAAKSAVSVEYSDRERRLDLQDGVAFFTVAHNKERPFVVHVGRFCVRAVGTAFNVRSAGDRVVVTVAEGAVDVYPENGGAAAATVKLDAGKEAVWPAEAAAPTVAAVDPAHALAWREGRLDYLNEPLSSAVADINRYSQRRVIIRDAAVGRIVFSGTVLIGNTDDWVRALPNLFPIDVLTDAQGNVVLVARSS